jgi:hypothetical protein
LDLNAKSVIEMPKAKNWIQNVKTTSTYPPNGIFTKDAKSMARVMSSKGVSPKGIGSAIRMIQFFINREAKICLHQKSRAGKSKRKSKTRTKNRRGTLKKR